MSGERVLSPEAKKELEYNYVSVKKLFNTYHGSLEKEAKEIGLIPKPNKENGITTASDSAASSGASASPGKGKGKEKQKAGRKSKEDEEKQKAFIPDTTEQQKGLAAAFAAIAHEDEKDLIAKEMGVSIATVDKYIDFFENARKPGYCEIYQTKWSPTNLPS